MRILVAVDESENSNRAVKYVGSLLRETSDTAVTLFHVLKPMPRGLLEHGGSENPAAEAQLSEQLRRDQEAWIRQEAERECPFLIKAFETLTQSGFDRSRVALRSAMRTISPEIFWRRHGMESTKPSSSDGTGRLGPSGCSAAA